MAASACVTRVLAPAGNGRFPPNQAAAARAGFEIPRLAAFADGASDLALAGNDRNPHFHDLQLKQIHGLASLQVLFR